MISPELKARWGRFTGTDTPVLLLFLTLSGVLSLAFSVFFFNAERPYETEGVPATAEVIARSHYTRREKQSLRDVYELRYRYRDTAGKDHVGSDEVHRDYWFQYARGSRLPIRYLRSRPDRSHSAILPASRHRIALTFTASLGALFLLGAVAIGTREWVRACRPAPSPGETKAGGESRRPRRRKSPKGRRRP